MHELLLARSLIESVRRHLPARCCAVRRVNVVIGEATGIVLDAFELAFRASSQGTPVAGAKLSVERVRSRSVCINCTTEFDFDGGLGACPTCGALSSHLLAGAELELRSIEVDDV